MVSATQADIRASMAGGTSEILTSVINIKKGSAEENLIQFDSLQVPHVIQTAAELRGILSAEVIGPNDKFLNKDGYLVNTWCEGRIKWIELLHGNAIRIISSDLSAMDRPNKMNIADSLFNETCVDSDESSHADTSNSSEYENVHATGSVLEGQGKYVALDQVESISQASFEQNAAVLACLAVRYIYKGVEGFKSSGSYLARYNCDERNLVLQDIPNGSLIKFVADISAMKNAELVSNRWYLYDRNSQGKAHLSLTGTAFKVWFNITIL